MSALKKMEAIIEAEFDEAARRATKRIRPLLLAELKKLRKVLPVTRVAESMGDTVVFFNGKTNFLGYRVDDIRWGDLPEGITPDMRAKLNEFMELIVRVSDQRQAYCLYDDLSVIDV